MVYSRFDLKVLFQPKLFYDSFHLSDSSQSIKIMWWLLQEATGQNKQFVISNIFVSLKPLMSFYFIKFLQKSFFQGVSKLSFWFEDLSNLFLILKLTTSRVLHCYCQLKAQQSYYAIYVNLLFLKTEHKQALYFNLITFLHLSTTLALPSRHQKNNF